MRKILSKIKLFIKSIIQKILGTKEIKKKISSLEEVTTNIDVHMQMQYGLNYLDKIKYNLIVENDQH